MSSVDKAVAIVVIFIILLLGSVGITNILTNHREKMEYIKMGMCQDTLNYKWEKCK